MQNLKSLSNFELHQKTKSLAEEERKLTTAILWNLHEIQSRRLYAEKGYASLFEYAVKELGYSDAAAGRRISAMRLLVSVPELEPALESGKTNLSTLCTLQHFFQNKEVPVSYAEKKEIVFAMQSKSRRECEKQLATLDPKPFQTRDRERAVSKDLTEIRFVADDALLEKLQKIREIDAHVHPDPSYLELFHRMADLCLKKLDPTAPKRRAAATNSAKETPSKENSAPPVELKSSQRKQEPSPRSNQRYIPAEVRRAVWRKDQGQCTFRSSEGNRCGSRYALEIDHKLPLSLGGKTELSNLRLLCRVHNQHQALRVLGPAVMRPYLS